MAVRVHPVDDTVPHDPDVDCVCGPRVEWTNPDTGSAYPSGPMVVHHSLDGREHDEPAVTHPAGWQVDLV